jgi:hypothetical protein
MMNAEMESKYSNFIQNKSSLFEFPKFDGFYLLSEIILKVSKHFPILIFSFASLKLLLVVNDIYSNNIGFAVLNSIFAIGDFIFLVQICQRRKTHEKQTHSSSTTDSQLMEGNLE